MYIKRQLESILPNASGSYPIVMVCGQRQVGKSTMLHHLMEKDRRYVSFDDIDARKLAENDPKLFFETYGNRLLIDEFQRVPSILVEMKRIVDDRDLKGEDTAGMFWLTGSQKFKMMKDVSETLAGRVCIFELSSLSQNETDGNCNGLFIPKIESLKERKFIKRDLKSTFEKILKGGMPKLFSSKVERKRYFMNYVQTYIERDIAGNIGKLDEFYHFLVYMAANTSHELIYSNISKEIGVSAVTVKEWTGILERSGVIFILHPYYSKITDRLVKTPKMYFMDTGLATYLTKWNDAETLESGAYSGAIFETYAVSEIVKSYYNAGLEAELYYYRDIDKKEIDLLIADNNELYPMEIKKSKSPSDAGKNIDALAKFGMKINPLIVLCMADELLPQSRNVWLCPIEKI